MIYAPHPLADSTGALSKKIKNLGVDLASPTQYPSKIPLWEAADVIIGATSGAFHTATFLADKPLILFRQSSWYTSQKCSVIVASHSHFVLHWTC